MSSYGFPKKAEDAAHSSGDEGFMALGVRNDTHAAFSGTDADYTPLAVTSEGFLKTSPQNGRMASYIATTGKFVPAASPTDVFEMSGSSSKTIYIQEIVLVPANAGAGGANVYEAYLNRRSTASSGGTSTAITPQKLDTNNASSTIGVCKYFTANPTVGTLVGAVGHSMVQGGIGYWGGNATLFKADTPSQALVLRGTSEYLTVNLNGAVLSSSGTPYITIIVKFTEVTN